MHSNKKDPLLQQLNRCLISKDNVVYPPKILSLLEKVTPNIHEIINISINDINKKYGDGLFIKIENNLDNDSVFVFGQKEFLSKTLENLLSNPINCYTLKELKIILKVNFDENQNNVILTVIDNFKITTEDIQSSFNKAGGLKIQQTFIKEWGGDMGGKIENNNTCYYMILQRSFRLNKEEF